MLVSEYYLLVMPQQIAVRYKYWCTQTLFYNIRHDHTTFMSVCNMSSTRKTVAAYSPKLASDRLTAPVRAECDGTHPYAQPTHLETHNSSPSPR